MLNWNASTRWFTIIKPQMRSLAQLLNKLSKNSIEEIKNKVNYWICRCENFPAVSIAKRSRLYRCEFQIYCWQQDWRQSRCCFAVDCDLLDLSGQLVNAKPIWWEASLGRKNASRVAQSLAQPAKFWSVLLEEKFHQTNFLKVMLICSTQLNQFLEAEKRKFAQAMMQLINFTRKLFLLEVEKFFSTAVQTL